MTSHTVRWNDCDYQIEAEDPIQAASQWAEMYYWLDSNVEIVVSNEGEVVLVEIAKVGGS